MPVHVAGFVNQALPIVNYPGPSRAGVGQGQWRTMRLAANEYLTTGGLTACSGFTFFDPVAGVASLAHFDGSQATVHIDTMLAEMLLNHATLGNIRAAISGWPDFNMTAQSVYNDLLVAARIIAQNHTQVYNGRDMLCVFGDGRVGWFGLD